MSDAELFDPQANMSNDKKDGVTDITVILDRSGSMNTVLEPTITGFNKFIDEQKAVKGKARMTLVQFDNQYEVVYKDKDIQDVPELTAKTFIPRGGTALLDAIGMAVASKKESIINIEEKPTNVVIVVITDGEENMSMEYKHNQVQDTINKLKEHWQFVFLGAGQDAIQQATSMGFNANMAAHYSHDSAGVHKSYGITSRNVSMMRSNTNTDINNAQIMSFSTQDRTAMVDSNDHNHIISTTKEEDIEDK